MDHSSHVSHMDMGHGGMDMGDGSCKISMLWNWYTIDACFLSESWHVRSQGAFAASCIGVIALVMLVEFFRRLGKEYDAHLLRSFQRAAAVRVATDTMGLTTEGGLPSDRAAFPGQIITLRATFVQQLVRALLHAVTFGIAYIVMLLAMYFNGYIIICIFIGAGLGKFVCDWLEVKIRFDDIAGANKAGSAGGISEPTVCCG
ncbi:hypothetical protein VHEMI10418 [[Torrubiella] hemipterigena]|uniref:Copper transport protein n=1 Tax=[Torrubiella] hemipterigena TaxID=1531966 RepID=A0A0A1TCY6_9HYPO|nr:hypothetical protein VHEMI10418 [[Torrubiella] hemipterigena]